MMKFILLIAGLLLALYGFNFLIKYIKIRRGGVRTVGRIVDNEKRDADKKLPGGWAPVAEYEVKGKKIQGVSELPAAQRYSLGYQVELVYKKDEPTSFLLGAYLSAMKLYICVLLPLGLLLAVWGVYLFF